MTRAPAGSPVEVILLVPGLLGPRGAGSRDSEAAHALVEGLDVDALDRLLARAAHAAVEATDASFEALAFRSFGYPARPSPDWPVAAFTSLVDCDTGGSEFRLRADPVHLRPDIADLVLFDAADAGVSHDEAAALAQFVNDALRPSGPFVDAAHPHRWYVALDAPVRMTTTPLSLAAGAAVSTAMPHGPDAPRWHRWMNEMQMALHRCPLNMEREHRGAAPINSIWPWGVGRLPPPPGAPPVPFARVWSDDVLVRGLARHAGVESSVMPAGAREWLSRPPRPGRHLVVFDTLFRAVRRADIDAWRRGIARLAALWAAPLLDALERGVVACVSIHEERGHRFTATRRGGFRWWRRGGLAARIADPCG